MNLINRLIIALQLMVAAAAATLLVLFVVGLVPADLLPGNSWIAGWLESVPTLPALERLELALMALGIATVSLIVLVFELFPSPVFDRLRIAQRRGESLSIDKQSVQRLAERTGRAMEGVRTFKVSVKATRRGVRLRCKALVETGAPLVELGERLQTALNERVAEVVGLKVVRSDIRMRFDDSNPEDASPPRASTRSTPPPLERKRDEASSSGDEDDDGLTNRDDGMTE